MGSRNGLTLVEILVVVTILGILMFMATSVGRSAVQRSSFSGAVNGFIADFQFAKQLASTENRYVMVEFADNGRAYSIKRQKLIGDFSQWESVRDVSPMDGKEFFNGASTPDFTVNSLGQVYPWPPTGMVPGNVSLQFYIRQRDGGKKDYCKNLSLFPSGGYKVE